MKRFCRCPYKKIIFLKITYISRHTFPLHLLNLFLRQFLIAVQVQQISVIFLFSSYICSLEMINSHKKSKKPDICRHKHKQIYINVLVTMSDFTYCKSLHTTKLFGHFSFAKTLNQYSKFTVINLFHFHCLSPFLYLHVLFVTISLCLICF